MEGGRRRRGRQEKTWSLMGLNSTAGDVASRRRRRRKKKELVHCHTFGESHRMRQKRSRRRKHEWNF